MAYDGDIFDQDGALTPGFLLARGYCCGNGCRNCPYIPRHGGVDAVAPAARPEPYGPATPGNVLASDS